MDASSDDDNEEEDVDLHHNQNGNKQSAQPVQASVIAEAKGLAQQIENGMNYITDASAKQLDDTDGGCSFIVGANATQLDEYGDYDDNGQQIGYNDGDGDVNKEEKFKYHEQNDLSFLDNDPAIKQMLLNEDEQQAKNAIFEICNPDYKQVKKQMDRKAMIKEEKERKNKRKIGQSYKDDPHGYIAGKLSKRFKAELSDKTNKEAYYRLIGKELPSETTTSVCIKKLDPLSSQN